MATGDPDDDDHGFFRHPLEIVLVLITALMFVGVLLFAQLH
jgi:hypothetical protein